MFALLYCLSLFNATLVSITLLLNLSLAWSTDVASVRIPPAALQPGQHREPASRPRSLHRPWLTAAETNATEKGFYLFSGEHSSGSNPFMPSVRVSEHAGSRGAWLCVCRRLGGQFRQKPWGQAGLLRVLYHVPPERKHLSNSVV